MESAEEQMVVHTKICGLRTAETIKSAIDSGAKMIGFNFFARSPRAVSLTQAEELAALVPSSVDKVALTVDASDTLISNICEVVEPDYLQLHGDESLEHLEYLRKMFGRPLIKVISVATQDDLDRAHTYEEAADMIMLDAKPNSLSGETLPGGNGVPFDWSMVTSHQWKCPWLLAGGLTVDNLPQAVATTRANIVDVSSGVEDRPGQKSVTKIRAFLACASRL